MLVLKANWRCAYLHKQFPAIADIADVVQESHLRLLRANDKGRIQSAKSYLFAIARNVATGVFRRAQNFSTISINEMEGVSVLEEDPNVAEHASIQQEITLAIEARGYLLQR